jgi:hypothetical protein
MPRFFDEKGIELKPVSVEGLEQIGEIGGKPEKTSVTISVYSEELDKDKVSELLGVSPTKAWNPRERHSSGGKQNKKTRILEWGKWYLSTETNDDPLDAKIENLFALCAPNLETWKWLSEEYETWLTIVGHINNWNREVHLSRKTLKLITDRSLDLVFDIYFDTDDDEN